MKKSLLSIRISLLVLVLLIGTNSIKSQGLVEPMDTGKFQPTWASLKQYSSAPDWYRDAKFGIWAHWGPQCQPEQGDWFARFMYVQKAPEWGRGPYEYHRRTYGHP